jgi:P27 family predicted phage terminase small subunit
LISQNTLVDSDASLLKAYVAKIMLAERSRDVAEKDGPFVKGSRGQLVAHPGLKIAREAEADAVSLARQLLLTPYSRKAAGIQVAEASDELDKLLSE